MYCTQCGHANADSDRFCAKCGQALAGGAAAPAAPAREVYAGFWMRLAAYLVDYGIQLGAGIALTALLVALPTGVDTEGAAFLAFISLVMPWLYSALLESSARQATVGKRVLGIKVTGMDGQRISFGRATGRFFAMILSGLALCIGYVMIAFTARRQGLHDLIAGTLVVRANADSAQLAGGGPVASRMPGWAIALIVLACLVPVFGILAAIAIPAYQDYTIRAQVHEGLTLAADVKAGVAEFTAQTGRWPFDLEEAGIDADVASAVEASRYVGDIQVADGTIHIEFGGEANQRIDGQVLSLRPFVNDAGDVIWQCGNSGDPPDGAAILELEDGSYMESGENYTSLDDKHMPQACRSGFDGARGGTRT